MDLRERLFGPPRSLRDPGVFHRISLAAFLAWVGLGADGLSSSAYGPEESFRHLGGHGEFAVFLAIATTFTVFIISYAYSRIIELFPHGGGGYVVASKLLGTYAGVTSGAALLVDYVLTISISIASGANAVFAFLPLALQPYKFGTEVVVIGLLVVMNLRGVKESVMVLAPIFLAFLLTHAILILGAVFSHLGNVDRISHDVRSAGTLFAAAPVATALLFARAYAMGGGTYTGIEAVSNGLMIMREPRVATGRRTMIYMATSLALTAGGILVAYRLLGTAPSATKPMNAVLAEAFAGRWRLGGIPVGKIFVVVTLVAEGALLFVAAQAGFIDGPRVMANMARDGWMPRQFATLSERLTMRNGVYLMGGAALATLYYTRGNVHFLAVMYSINVFLTFSLSQLAMTRHWLYVRNKDSRWWRRLAVHGVGLVLCVSILALTTLEKFRHGGWITLSLTVSAVVLCAAIRTHYKNVSRQVRTLDEELIPSVTTLPPATPDAPLAMDPTKPTAVLLAGGFGGLGLHTLLQIQRVFPGEYRQVVFISAGVIDSGNFKGADAVGALGASIQKQLDQYVQVAQKKLGWAADSEMSVGTDSVTELERLCREVYLRFPRSVFFAGQIIFREPRWWHRFLHNDTAYSVQRRLLFDGLTMVILPVRLHA